MLSSNALAIYNSIGNQKAIICIAYICGISQHDTRILLSVLMVQMLSKCFSISCVYVYMFFMLPVSKVCVLWPSILFLTLALFLCLYACCRISLCASKIFVWVLLLYSLWHKIYVYEIWKWSSDCGRQIDICLYTHTKKTQKKNLIISSQAENRAERAYIYLYATNFSCLSCTYYILNASYRFTLRFCRSRFIVVGNLSFFFFIYLFIYLAVNVDDECVLSCKVKSPFIKFNL